MSIEIVVVPLIRPLTRFLSPSYLKVALAQPLTPLGWFSAADIRVSPMLFPVRLVMMPLAQLKWPKESVVKNMAGGVLIPL